MKKSYFTSDLHLFANRSEGELYLDAISHAASGAECFVLGGDIFDFRWATTATVEEAVDEAVGWLGRLAWKCPDCEFHFLLGNHDYHGAFIRRLIELDKDAANLCWHRFYVRLGSSMFLHGDVADRKMDSEKLADARSRWIDDSRKGRFLHLLYDLAVLARLHKPIPYLAYPKRIVARRILAYLKHIGHGPGDGVRNVYFGHTHRALSDYRYRGLIFHNGGAPIKGLEFRILEAEVCV